MVSPSRRDDVTVFRDDPKCFIEPGAECGARTLVSVELNEPDGDGPTVGVGELRRAVGGSVVDENQASAVPEQRGPRLEVGK